MTSHDLHTPVSHVLKGCTRDCKGLHKLDPPFTHISFTQLVPKIDNYNFYLNMLSKRGPETQKGPNILRINLTQGNINKTAETNRGRSFESIVCHMGRKTRKEEVRGE